MAAIISWLTGTSSTVDYAAIQKKNDDVYIEAIEGWMLKYQPEKVDTIEKIELMLVLQNYFVTSYKCIYEF